MNVPCKPSIVEGTERRGHKRNGAPMPENVGNDHLWMRRPGRMKSRQGKGHRIDYDLGEIRE